MFTGCYYNSIDAKGRVFVPTKLRFLPGDRLWVVRFDECLYIFTDERWTAFTNEYVSNRTLKDPKARKLQRFVFGYSREIEIDKQGRINLPQDFIDYAGIEKNVVFVGCGDRVELWSAEGFEKEMDPKSFDLGSLMQDAVEIEVAAPGEA